MNVFELFASLSLDTSGYDEGLESSESKGASFVKKIGSGLATVGAATAKATIAGFTAAATGVTVLTKQSVEAYGEFEQLAGGVEKLFGDSADTIFAYSENAYKAAGMSANDYMETITGFSASLIQGLDGDTEEAARIANMAIEDMSDNANVFGSDISTIQSAYQGFAKQNYTMLDNLKLGYGGTQEEMIRLINDSGILEKEIESLDDITFDQMIEAIHEIQTDLSITGTTANEASSTIQGSIASLQGAWQNLLVGLSNPDADLGQLITNVVDSAKTALGNIIPVASQALSGISELVGQLAPVIAEELPGLVDQILPTLLTTITTLLDTAVSIVSNILPSLITTLLPTLISAATTLLTTFVTMLPTIINILKNAIPQIFNMLVPAIVNALPIIITTLVELIMEIATALADNAQMIVDALVTVIETVVGTLSQPDMLTQFIEVVVTLIEAVVTAVLDATPTLTALVPQIVAALIVALFNNLDNILVAIGNILASVGASLIGGIGALMGLSEDEISQGLVAIGEAVLAGFDSILDFFANLADGLTTGVTALWEGITSLFSSGLDSITSFVSDGLDGVANLFSNIWETIKTTVSNGIETVKSLFDFEWSLPDLKLPHFTVSGGESPYGLGGKGSFPSIGIEWYAKAYDDAYMLSDATIFGSQSGNLLAGGENGSEMIVGKDYFENVMIEAASRIQIQPIVTVNIAGEELDGYTVSAEKRIALVDGGRG